MDLEASFVEDTYIQDVIRYLDNKNIVWGSIFVDTIHTDTTFIPLEFSAYYKIDEDIIFEIDILGVKLMASKSIHNK